MTATADFYQRLSRDLDAIRAKGLYKTERVIASAQGATVKLEDGREVLNLCANNYLGLSADPAVISAAHESLASRGFGLSSVRFICGTQDIHKTLEHRLAQFLGTEDVILYAAAFDANGGLFEPLLGEEDAIISDELNHASIIDGVRLCKAQRFRYKHNDMADLEAQLKEATRDDASKKAARTILIFTDGVFSMDGTIARLDKICDLAERYGALVGFDDAHATGFLGRTGRGTHEYRGVMARVDIITGTLGKALGGASGGFTAARKPVIDMLRQRSRPYLFSNTLAPSIVGATIAVLDLLTHSTALRDKLEANTKFFRREIAAAGFDIKSGDHPIVPIMVYDAAKAQQLSARLLELGIYAVGFFYPVVPNGQARIRVQVSAVHSQDQLAAAVKAFRQAGIDTGILAEATAR